jgi:hypothetical protein
MNPSLFDRKFLQTIENEELLVDPNNTVWKFAITCAAPIDALLAEDRLSVNLENVATTGDVEETVTTISRDLVNLFKREMMNLGLTSEIKVRRAKGLSEIVIFFVAVEQNHLLSKEFSGLEEFKSKVSEALTKQFAKPDGDADPAPAEPDPQEARAAKTERALGRLWKAGVENLRTTADDLSAEIALRQPALPALPREIAEDPRHQMFVVGRLISFSRNDALAIIQPDARGQRQMRVFVPQLIDAVLYALWEPDHFFEFQIEEIATVEGARVHTLQAVWSRSSLNPITIQPPENAPPREMPNGE